MLDPEFTLADDFPPAYRGSSFVCDPANNLVHRDVLVPNGATFTARRGEAGRRHPVGGKLQHQPLEDPDGAPLAILQRIGAAEPVAIGAHLQHAVGE